MVESEGGGSLGSCSGCGYLVSVVLMCGGCVRAFWPTGEALTFILGVAVWLRNLGSGLDGMTHFNSVGILIDQSKYRFHMVSEKYK